VIGSRKVTGLEVSEWTFKKAGLPEYKGGAAFLLKNVLTADAGAAPEGDRKRLESFFAFR
jgi:hypothetical protein